jgi:hypothetical protein
MKPTLITWYFNDDGNLEMACYLELKTAKPDEVQGIFLRSLMGRDNVALLHIPEDVDRKELQSYVENKTIQDEVVTKLKNAKVRKDQILRKKLENNAADFLSSLRG